MPKKVIIVCRRITHLKFCPTTSTIILWREPHNFRSVIFIYSKLLSFLASFIEMLQSALQSSIPNPTSECAPLSQSSENESLPPSTSSTSSSAREPTFTEQLSRANSQPQTPTSSNHPERSAQVQTLIDRLPQLQAMRELGITDEIVAIQALEAANGDLEIAINIIFSEDN